MNLIRGLIKKYFSLYIINLFLLLLSTQAEADVILFENFDDGNANGWTIVNDSGKASKWQVISGKYNQLNVNIGKLVQSFIIGSYSRYNNGFTLTDYEVSVKVTSVGGGSVGVMFRYQNNDNYYRFSINPSQGFSRLEKKVNGVFTTLASNGRGPVLNRPHAVRVDLDGSKILVYLNGSPLFSVLDPGLSSGTVALFAQSNARFNDVVIKDSSPTPEVVVSNPTSYSVKTINVLQVSAVARNIPPGGGVRFVLDNKGFFTDFTQPYSRGFSNVSLGSHKIKVFIVSSSGNPIPGTFVQDTNVRVGVKGEYFVALGDSITNGTGDDFPDDNRSLDGRNISRGFTPVLNDLLSGSLNKPVTVMNEGLGGTKAGTGAGSGVSRLNSTLARHLTSKYWLILFGTNDSGGSLPVPSGKGLQPGDPGYVGTFKDSMQIIITNLKNSGKVPLPAKVPFIRNASSITDQLIRDYNTAIDELVLANNIAVTPPDFYNYFEQNPGELPDGLHPNGNGYISMANLWFDALIESGILSQ